MRFDNLAFMAFTLVGISAPRQTEIEALAAHIRNRDIDGDEMVVDGLPLSVLDEIPDVLTRLGETTSAMEISRRTFDTWYSRAVHRSARRGAGHQSRSVRLREVWRRQPGVRARVALMAA